MQIGDKDTVTQAGDLERFGTIRGEREIWAAEAV
jgi:hypothetical protein